MLKKSEPKGIKMEFARVLILTVCVLSCLCGFIYWSVQEVIITNENEYLLVSVQRLSESALIICMTIWRTLQLNYVR